MQQNPKGVSAQDDSLRITPSHGQAGGCRPKLRDTGLAFMAGCGSGRSARFVVMGGWSRFAGLVPGQRPNGIYKTVFQLAAHRRKVCLGKQTG